MITYYNPYELYHHGIKGQKWGVRRFQNRNGDLTQAGKKRYDNPYELYHHGIKGMRWGVRRFQNRDGTYTPLGQRRRSEGNPEYERVPRDYTKAKRIAKGVAKGVGIAALVSVGTIAAASILTGPAGQKAISTISKNLSNPQTKERIASSVKRKALRTTGAMVDGAMSAIGGLAAAALVAKIGTSTKKGQIASRATSEGVRELTRTNFRNANFSGSKIDKNSKEYQNLFKNQNGGIRSEDERKKIKGWVNDGLSIDQIQKKIDEELTHSDELFHHGIKGQKWGVRRFQNKDGSLKPAGEKRYYGHNTSDSSGPSKASSSSSSSEKTKKPGLFSPDNPNAERNKKIAKAVAITAGVAAASVAAFCVAKKVNSGMEEASKLLSNEETRKHMLEEARYHRDSMKDLMDHDRVKKIDTKYGADVIRDATLRKDKALLNQKEWNLNLAQQHYNTAKKQLEEGRADKRIGKYISKVEATRERNKQKAEQQSKGKEFQQAQYLLKQVAYLQGLGNSNMYSNNRNTNLDNARKGREQLEKLAQNPSIASMLKSYASSVNLPGMRELADDILRKGA